MAFMYTHADVAASADHLRENFGTDAANHANAYLRVTRNGGRLDAARFWEDVLKQLEEIPKSEGGAR